MPLGHGQPGQRSGPNGTVYCPFGCLSENGECGKQRGTGLGTIPVHQMISLRLDTEQLTRCQIWKTWTRSSGFSGYMLPVITRNWLSGRWWAKEYDQDLEETFAWVGPRRAAEVLAEHVAPTSKVLDAGAGTGLVGVELQRLGFSDLCAMTLSQGMLAEARAKGCYNDSNK